VVPPRAPSFKLSLEHRYAMPSRVRHRFERQLASRL
jgi:hypothetical protein